MLQEARRLLHLLYFISRVPTALAIELAGRVYVRRRAGGGV